jgi:hypothetical protein
LQEFNLLCPVNVAEIHVQLKKHEDVSRKSSPEEKYKE